MHQCTTQPGRPQGSATAAEAFDVLTKAATEETAESGGGGEDAVVA